MKLHEYLAYMEATGILELLELQDDINYRNKIFVCGLKCRTRDLME